MAQDVQKSAEKAGPVVATIGGGAAAGAGIGALVGGPFGAVIGAGCGAIVGGIGAIVYAVNNKESLNKENK